jgi:hypothetical protein
MLKINILHRYSAFIMIKFVFAKIAKLSFATVAFLCSGNYNNNQKTLIYMNELDS